MGNTIRSAAKFNNQHIISTIAVGLISTPLLVSAAYFIAVKTDQITLVSNLTSEVCALIAVIFFLRTWAITPNRDMSKKFLGWSAAGIVFWTVAELTWGTYEVILGVESPFPSVADALWLIGYIPFYYAVFMRYKAYRNEFTPKIKRTILLIVAAFSMIIFLLIVRPMLTDFDADRLVESLLNIAYPVFDLVLLILTAVIIFSLEQGRYAFVWRLFGLGLILTSVGDLLFSYASWNEIYYPDSQLNSISFMIDLCNDLSYIALALTAITYDQISTTLQVPKISLVLPPPETSKILILVNAVGRIISSSDNLLNLLHVLNRDQYLNELLSKALRTDERALHAILDATLENGSLSNQPLTMHDKRGDPRGILFSSLAVKDEHGKLSCYALILRVRFLPEDGKERPTTEEQKLMLDHYLSMADADKNEEGKALKTYFIGQINLLYSLIQQFSGNRMAEGLLQHLTEMVTRNQWNVSLIDTNIMIPEDYNVDKLGRHLQQLLQEAIGYTENVVNLKMVQQEMAALERNLSGKILPHIHKHGLNVIPGSPL